MGPELIGQLLGGRRGDKFENRRFIKCGVLKLGRIRCAAVR